VPTGKPLSVIIHANYPCNLEISEVNYAMRGAT
jgi:hypothetical protein